MLKNLRKRGADTKQKIAYLLAFVILSAIAVFGFLFFSSNLDKEDIIRTVNGIRVTTAEMIDDGKKIPSINDGAPAIRMFIESTGMQPSVNASNFPGIRTGGPLIIVPTSFTAEGTTGDKVGVYLIFDDNGFMSQRICNSLTDGVDASIPASKPNVISGPFGINYSLTSDCSATNPVIALGFFNDI